VLLTGELNQESEDELMATGQTGLVGWIKSRAGIAFIGFVAIAVFFLWEEHKAHLLGAWPYVLLLLCPLSHLFHGGDPFCNMEVEESTAAGRFDYGGKTYFFAAFIV
jgi:hypothetical protein